MAKTITAAQLAAIIAADETVMGTAEYSRYYMEYQYKHNGKWKYGGWGIPRDTEEKPVKTYGGNRYIMINEEKRFLMTETVEALIKDI